MLCCGVIHAGTKPNIEIVPPVRVKTPQTPTFCFAREFCTAEAKSPAPPVRAIACNVWAMASFGSYAGSSMAFGLCTCSSVTDMTWPYGGYRLLSAIQLGSKQASASIQQYSLMLYSYFVTMSFKVSYIRYAHYSVPCTETNFASTLSQICIELAK